MRLANIVSISFAITLDEKFKFSVYPQCKITLKYKYETACTYSMVLAFRIHIIYIYIFFSFPRLNALQMKPRAVCLKFPTLHRFEISHRNLTCTPV